MYSQPKTTQELKAMQISGQMLATVLQLMVVSVVAGITSKALAQIAAKELKALGGRPAFLGVQPDAKTPPFPDIICISVSEEVQHGIPSNRVIQNGDIVNFDFGVNYQGMITDAGLTVPCGQISASAQHLLQSTKKALYAGLKQVRTGANVRHISGAIEEVLTKAKLGIVYELVGHGVGHHLHEDPEIPNYEAGAPDYVLKENQTIAIEPIATLGSGKIRLGADKWTLMSVDGALAAHFEHTVQVTNAGCRILTQL